MSFEKNFCSSPWFHMRINNSGSYEYCRWKTHDWKTQALSKHNIVNQTPTEYFQSSMSTIRLDLLQGKSLPECKDCYIMDANHKVSGRQRQLLKSGIRDQYFVKTLASSPMLTDFSHSEKNNGHTNRRPIDWQIDLGNYCNSACIFCNAESSSRLASELLKLGAIDQLPSANWCDDPVLLEKFIDDLCSTDNLRYLHFLGGETVITPAFQTILQALTQRLDVSKISIGFTTNLTVWSDPVIELLKQFSEVNLGMSIETLTPVNDYVRWPSKIPQVRQYLDRWVALAKQQQWLIQLRVTPTCLTIQDLGTVYDYAWQHEIAVESCNFLHEPAHLRISVLPKQQRQAVADRLQTWLDQHPVDELELLINTRNPDHARVQIYQDLQSYISYLDQTLDESHRLPDLVKYLKLLENNRKNSILEYLPEYETIFRSAGY